MAVNYKSSISRYRKYLTQLQQQPLLRASFLLILSLILLILLLLLVLRPTLITISSLLGQINTQREIEQKLDAKIAALQQAQILLNSLQSRLVSLDNSLPSQADMGIWTQAVEVLASGSGVTIVDLSLVDVPLVTTATPSGQLASLTKINFKLTASGDYTQLADFVTLVEKLPRLAILDSVQISRGSAGALTLAVEGTINFTYSGLTKAFSASP